MKTLTHDTISELEDFVITQAAEDAALPAGEQRYQAELVKDVLGQEVSSSKSLDKLLKLYRSQRQAA